MPYAAAGYADMLLPWRREADAQQAVIFFFLPASYTMPGSSGSVAEVDAILMPFFDADSCHPPASPPGRRRCRLAAMLVLRSECGMIRMFEQQSRLCAVAWRHAPVLAS